MTRFFTTNRIILRWPPQAALEGWQNRSKLRAVGITPRNSVHPTSSRLTSRPSFAALRAHLASSKMHFKERNTLYTSSVANGRGAASPCEVRTNCAIPEPREPMLAEPASTAAGGCDPQHERPSALPRRTRREAAMPGGSTAAARSSWKARPCFRRNADRRALPSTRWWSAPASPRRRSIATGRAATIRRSRRSGSGELRRDRDIQTMAHILLGATFIHRATGRHVPRRRERAGAGEAPPLSAEIRQAQAPIWRKASMPPFSGIALIGVVNSASEGTAMRSAIRAGFPRGMTRAYRF